MKIFIGILLACSSLLQAQNLKLGFDIGFHQVKIDKANNSQNLGTEGLPLAAHLDLSFSPLKDISFLAQIGRTFDTEFKGWEFGIGGRYKFISRVYFATGVLQHSNEGFQIGNEEVTFYSSIWTIYLGGGVQITNSFSMELKYYVPVSKPKLIKYLRKYDENPSTWEAYTFKNMIRLNFLFGWNI